MLVIEERLISIDYFMDKLQPWEVSNILENINYANRTSWEQTRLIMYVMAQANSSKKIKIEDMMHFEWDKANHDTSISNNDIKRLQERMKSIQELNVN